MDDNVSNRTVLHHQLSSWHIAHDAVDSGAEALELLRREAQSSHPYDIALLDIHMPGMSGIELASAIRGDPPDRLDPSANACLRSRAHHGRSGG